MRLIHLSDIHFSAGDHWDPDDDQRNELLLDIDRLVSSGGAVDGILVGGDIAFSGGADEYAVAGEWLEEARVRGGCPVGAVWTVPGNHDVDRAMHNENFARHSMIEKLQETDLTMVDHVLSKFLYAGDGMINCLDEYNRFATQWLSTTSAAKPHWTDPTLDLDGLDICLTGLNSVLVSDTSDKHEEHDGKAVLLLGRQQCALERDADRIHIAFAHHPPSWLRDWSRVQPFLKRAHLVLFGHEHQFRANQEAPGLTVTIHAGAVAPERGQVESGLYRPSWNLISLDRAGDEVHVSIYPRVWMDDDTCFAQHPDGVRTFRVRIDLTPITDDASAPNLSGQETDADDERRMTVPGDPSERPQKSGPATDSGTNTSPLVPGSNEIHEGVALPSAAERSRLRDLAVGFMRLTPTRRNQVAARLEVADGLSELGLDATELGREILRRVRNAHKIDQLAQELGHG